MSLRNFSSRVRILTLIGILAITFQCRGQGYLITPLYLDMLSSYNPAASSSTLGGKASFIYTGDFPNSMWSVDIANILHEGEVGNVGGGFQFVRMVQESSSNYLIKGGLAKGFQLGDFGLHSGIQYSLVNVDYNTYDPVTGELNYDKFNFHHLRPGVMVEWRGVFTGVTTEWVLTNYPEDEFVDPDTYGNYWIYNLGYAGPITEKVELLATGVISGVKDFYANWYGTARVKLFDRVSVGFFGSEALLGYDLGVYFGPLSLRFARRRSGIPNDASSQFGLVFDFGALE